MAAAEWRSMQEAELAIAVYVLPKKLNDRAILKIPTPNHVSSCRLKAAAATTAVNMYVHAHTHYASWLY